MASNKNNCKKSEILALHRLEFYKNKKQWKLSSEKAKQQAKPARESRCTASGKNKLDETYTADPVIRPEQETPSNINNAFILEMPTDHPSPHDILQTPVSSSSQTEGPKPDLVSTSVLQTHNDIWDLPEATLQPQNLYKNWSTGQDILDQQPLHIQNPDIWPNKLHTDTDPAEPVDSLQKLLKTISLSWTQNPSPEDVPPPCKAEQVETWTEASTPLKIQPQTRYIENNLAQKLQLNQENLHNNEQYPATTAPGPRFPCQNTTDPATPHPKPSTPEIRHDQRNSLNYLPDIWPTQPIIGPSGSTAGVSTASGGLSGWTGLHNPSENNIRMSEQDIFSLCNERPQYYVPDVWVNQDYTESTRTDSWACPAPPSTPEVCQNVWTNQFWQEKQQFWQNADKQDWPVPGEVPQDCDEEDTTFSKMQFGAANLVPPEHYRVKSQHQECSELTPELIHENTNQWLRRLMEIYMDSDDGIDCESLCDQLQAGSDSSTEFIRGAHEVAHSSENDTAEISGECACRVSCARASVAAPRVLARATRRAAAALALLLAEHALRDQLRLQNNRNMEHNRDSNLFAGEYVISGSHISQSNAELEMASADSVIKIKMGRPYRLGRNLDN